MIVVDTSALVEVALANARGDEAAAAMQGRAVLAPDLLDAEFMQAVKGLERGGLMSFDRAELAVARLIAGPIQRVSSRSLAHRAWGLRHNLSIYDALYVALAAQHDATLLTADRSTATAAMDAGVTVTLV